MATKKSTIVRNSQAAVTRAAFRALERHWPELGSRIAERVWFTVPATPSRTVRGRRGMPGGTPFAVQLGSSEVRGQTFGDAAAPAAYLVHGWGGWWQQLSSFVPVLLGEGYRVVAFDALGHGSSGPGSMGRRSSSLPEMAESYAAVVERLGAPALTVAHSMGCLAVLWGQATTGVAPGRQVLIAPAATTSGMVDVFSSAVALGPRLRAGLAERFHARIGRPLGDFDMLPLVQAEQRAGRLVPALIVHDRDDEVTSADEAALLADGWEGARLTLTRGLGHYRVMRDEAVLGEVARFLAAVPLPACAAVPDVRCAPRPVRGADQRSSPLPR